MIIFLSALPMKSKGKVGGQHKFPRVLKGKMLEEWEDFLNNNKDLVGKK